MRVRLREREGQSRRWLTRLDERLPRTATDPASLLTLSESSELALRVYPAGAADFEARVYVGNVLVASTLEKDRPDFLLRIPDESEEEDEYFSCHGRMLRDWVGLTELRVEVASGPEWSPVLAVPLCVTAGKIDQESFEALCTDIANYSAAVLFDVYGKTLFSLAPERRPGETAPVALLPRLRQVIDQMAGCLHAIAHQPASRLRTWRIREPLLLGQSVSDLSLEEACRDPTLLARRRGGICFREQVRETAAASFDVPENRLLSAFLQFLADQIADLRGRLQREIDLRSERRAYRHRRSAEGAKTWWETEDLPRIEALQKLLQQLAALDRDLARLRRHPFLPEGARLRTLPESTPLIRAHRAYAAAYKLIAAHFSAYRAQLDDQHLLTRAKSLPVLYEWWCVLEVLRILQSHLRLSPSASQGRGTPFRRLAEERDRFVIEFAADQAVDFEGEGGRLVRLRYVPCYRTAHNSGGLGYGLLGHDQERTPDIAIEIFAPEDGGSAPELILVLDAKYSTDSHQHKLDEVKRKYGKIGLFSNGSVLSRLVWALSPAPPQSPAATQPDWAAFCTIDNHGFWSDEFDMTSSAAGVVQAKPRLPFAGRSPLESLLRLVLRRCGALQP